MTNARKYNVGLVQMRMGADPEANFAAAVRHIREAARLGANIVCLPELFRAQYFCQREDHAALRSGRADSWAVDGAAGRGGPQGSRRHRRLALRAAGGGALSQHGGHAECRWGHRRRLSQDAHSGRSALLREVLLHAGRSGLSGRGYGLWARGHAGLLGSVVSRGRAADRVAGRGGAVLSDGHRLASGGKGRVWRGAI